MRRGLTLMEVVISSLLVGTVLVTSLASTASWRRYHVENREREIANRLAEELVSEMMCAAYIDPDQSSPQAFGLDSGESIANRSTWDDVDDYHDQTETTLRDKFGILIPDAIGYLRTTTIDHADSASSSPGYVITTDLSAKLRLLSVTVHSPSGITVFVNALKSNLDTTFAPADIHLQSVAIEFADGDQRIIRSAGVMNHPQVNP